jgi:hypothetical protein
MADKAINNACDIGVPVQMSDNGLGQFAEVCGIGKQFGPGGFTSINRLLSAAASTNATVVKNSFGRVYKIRGYNAAAAVRFLKIYNKATAPVPGTDTPVMTIALAPSSIYDLDLGAIGIYCSLGIGFALTVNAADTDTTALTAADVVGQNIIFA